MSWLDRHLAAAAPAARVLELGCGSGRDARRMRDLGFEVVATELSAEALSRAGRLLGSSALLRVDHSLPLPFRDAAFRCVVASLTLHYFSWAATRAAFLEIHRVLTPSGLALFRVNATDDVMHGAHDGIEVERHLRAYPDGRYPRRKRFFDEEDVRAALAGGFEIEWLEHMAIDRYELVKQVWECRARAC